MVDKIKSKKSAAVHRTQSLQPASAVSTAKLKIGSLHEIRRSRQSTRELNSEERELLKKIMHEEAEKMLGGGHAIPEAQRKIIEQAVEMAINSADLEENG